jgi:L-asparaginase II
VGAPDPVTVTVTRGRLPESVHRVHVAVADADGRVIAAAGDPGLRAFLRSAAKPLQALPLVESGAADRFGLLPPELAVACGSHEGAFIHQETVRTLLRRVGLDEGALRCGIHPPQDPEALAALVRAGEAPRRLHHNCSGKHAGMLATCVHRGWPLEYLGPDHPLQVWIREIVADAAGEAPELAVDGCGVPTFGLSLRGMATAYARLGSGQGLPAPRAAAAARLATAMAAHPVLVSGTGSVNTVMLARQGARWLTKGGAEGVWCLGLRPAAGAVLGVAVKTLDGSHRGTIPALCAALAALGVPGADDPELVPFARPLVRNTLDQVVGETRVALPAGFGRAG